MPYLLPTLVAFTVTTVSLTVAATIAFRCGALVLTPRQQTAVRVAIQVALVLSCAAVGAARYADLRAADHQHPVVCAAAMMASWAGALTLIPVPKVLNVFRLFGNGYERLIPYHATLGLITLAAGTLHGAWAMFKQLPTWTDAFVYSSPGPDGEKSNLAGFLAWLSFALIALSSHKKIRTRAFGLWRVTHRFLAAAAYILVLVHEPKTIDLMLPGMALYAVERLVRVAMTIAAGATIQDAIVHEEAGVIELRVRLHGLLPSIVPDASGAENDDSRPTSTLRAVRNLISRVLVPRLSAGDFVHIGVLCPTSPSLWRLSPAHPFTVARYDHADRTATFFVKAVGPWTRALLAAAHSDARPLLNARVSWCGPCGSLQVPLDSVPNHLLVCGGVGVTPMISILQALAAKKTSHQHASGEYHQLDCPHDTKNADSDAEMGEAVLVWCVRGLALATSLWPTVAPLAAAASVRVRIFDTSAATRHWSADAKVSHGPSSNELNGRGRADNAPTVGSSVSSPPTTRLLSPTCAETPPKSLLEIVECGRPDIAAVLEEMTGASSAMKVGVYCCGPAGLASQCVDAATARGNTFVHNEEF